jgi:hypothetical protein
MGTRTEILGVWRWPLNTAVNCVTRKLGVRYLWIDALCIIQDSMDDKAVEIGAMERIYTNSTVTIAIVNAIGATEGFLQTKPRLRVELPYRCPDGTFGSIQISPWEIIDLSQEILYTRAWCLQENLLSPRLLLFTNNEVIWQCESSPMRPVTRNICMTTLNWALHRFPDFPSPSSPLVLETLQLHLTRTSSFRSTPSGEISCRITLGAILRIFLIVSLLSRELPRNLRLLGQTSITLWCLETTLHRVFIVATEKFLVRGWRTILSTLEWVPCPVLVLGEHWRTYRIWFTSWSGKYKRSRSKIDFSGGCR